MRSMVAAAVVALAIVLAGCSGAAVKETDTSAPAITEAPADNGSAGSEMPAASDEAAASEPELTPEPANQSIHTFKTGDVVTVTSNDEDWAEITITKVSQKTKYGSGYLVDKPKKGNVYIQAYVTYKALVNGVDYNPYDWQVFVNDEAVDNTAFVTEGPTPELNYGTLPKGRVAKGWVVYEVPTKGKVVMSYQGNIFSDEGPVFEVVIRAK